MQSIAPFVPSTTTILEGNNESNVSSISLTNGSGHELAGTTLTIDGVEWTVREEADLDHWSTEEVYPNANGPLSIILDESGAGHSCSINGSTVIYHLIHLNGTIESDEIETFTNGNSSISCDVFLNKKGMVHVAYTENTNLKIGRLAVKNAVYSEQTWHLRTIAEDVVNGDGELQMIIDLDSKINIFFRDSDDALRQVWFNTAYWNNSILDSGPIGSDIEVTIDEDGLIHLVYTQTDEGEVRLIRFDDQQEVRQVLARGTDITEEIAMDLDSNLVEQVSYSQSDGQGNNTVSLLRSLAGKDDGRIDPNVK